MINTVLRLFKCENLKSVAVNQEYNRAYLQDTLYQYTNYQKYH